MLWLYFWFHLVFIISPHTQEIRQQPYPEQGGPPPRPIKHAINEQNNTDHHVLSSMFVFSLTPSASVNKPKILTFSFLSVSPSGPECSRNFTSSGGVIKSPGFPEKYPNNLDCTFMIFAPKMSEIVLEFESFELEPDTQPPTGVFCRYDRLEIWDGFPGGESLERSVDPNGKIWMFETKDHLVDNV